MKIKNRFYVGSRSMHKERNNEWAHPTIEEAIEHARQLCEETDEEQIVVQIIKIVKPQRKPVLVEDVE